MASKCIGCGKPIGGVLGAYGTKLFYGEVCLSCNKKLKDITGYQYLTPTQVNDIISNRVQKQDVKVESPFFNSGSSGTNDPGANKASSADEIRKYKELLDEGIITQEEFDIAKKRLLGL
ncbi:MAG: SHOCT domain-containing protein [Candidatus Methanoplasma sp.]|nr:SHOCT domain-containing protein [Candidatus Methanoplasma sp.]